MTHPVMLALSAVVVAAVLVATGCTAYRVDTARKLARASEPFAVAPADARAWLLVVGDSTAVGTGASTREMSVAGRLAGTFSRLGVVNVAADGARFADVVRQLQSAPQQRYDAVLIQAGGNDVIRLTGEEALRESVHQAVSLASARAPLVVLQPAGNVGNAPFFLPPLSWWMTRRAQTLHAIVGEVAGQPGVAYVNMYQSKDTDPFVHEAERLHAADGLHPSDDGYALWLDELLAQSPLRQALVDGQ